MRRCPINPADTTSSAVKRRMIEPRSHHIWRVGLGDVGSIVLLASMVTPQGMIRHPSLLFRTQRVLSWDRHSREDRKNDADFDSGLQRSRLARGGQDRYLRLPGKLPLPLRAGCRRHLERTYPDAG